MENKIREIIRKNFEKNVISIPWDGMHDEAVKKIMKIIEKKTWLAWHFIVSFRCNEK